VVPRHIQQRVDVQLVLLALGPAPLRVHKVMSVLDQLAAGGRWAGST
jgi:hypothetical protein